MTETKEYIGRTEHEYPYPIFAEGAGIAMIVINSPSSIWLRDKNYSYIVGGDERGLRYRFKEHAHAMEFVLRWL